MLCRRLRSNCSRASGSEPGWRSSEGSWRRSWPAGAPSWVSALTCPLWNPQKHLAVTRYHPAIICHTKHFLVLTLLAYAECGCSLPALHLMLHKHASHINVEVVASCSLTTFPLGYQVYKGTPVIKNQSPLQVCRMQYVMSRRGLRYMHMHYG